MLLTKEQIEKVLIAKRYMLYANKPNLIGVRSSILTDIEDAYNDKLYAFWGDEFHDYTITTHPGLYYLKNPIPGTKGTAILVEGQYKDCWTLGLHKQKQFALCQTSGEVFVYRDNNKDTMLSFDPKTIEKGYFGIDLHFGSVYDTNVIDKWSAGCQVFRYHQAHQDLMQKLKALSEKGNFTTFSYTLLKQSDFE